MTDEVQDLGDRHTEYAVLKSADGKVQLVVIMRERVSKDRVVVSNPVTGKQRLYTQTEHTIPVYEEES